MNEFNSNFDFKKFINQNVKLTIRIKFFVVALVVGMLYVVMYTPSFNFRFIESFRMILVFITILGLILFNKRMFFIKCFTVFYILSFVLNIASSPIFNSSKYYNLIGDVKTVQYSENKPAIDEEIIPIVDEQLAAQLGDKVIGQDLGLGSQYAVGKYHLVSTENDLVWVAPLEPRSFFKWLENREGSPGYVYVSATDVNDVRLVTEIDNSELKIKYTEKSYFFNEIKRHTYFSAQAFKKMTDFSFEIDDQGKPYWVISTYEPEIFFSGFDSQGVIIVDAQSGETQYYEDISKSPSWVERVVPEEIIDSQIEFWGRYKNGWLNSVLSQKEVITQTEGHSYVYIDNKPHYYSGLTSIEADKSTVGFMLVDVKTKNSTFYQINGATENAAQSSAQGQVQDLGYSASFPILLNTYSEPTYFMTLKDNDGLLKQYAFVSVENYNLVGVGNTINEAKKAYLNVLKDSNSIEIDETTKKSINGVVERINLVDSTYYMKIKDNPMLFKIDSSLSEYLFLTQVNDNVRFEYLEGEKFKEIISFSNESIEEK